MDFYDVISTRRSVRSYGNRQVQEEVLRKVLETARIAPSANNVQPWRHVIVKAKGKIRQIPADTC